MSYYQKGMEDFRPLIREPHGETGRHQAEYLGGGLVALCAGFEAVGRCLGKPSRQLVLDLVNLTFDRMPKDAHQD